MNHIWMEIQYGKWLKCISRRSLDITVSLRFLNQFSPHQPLVYTICVASRHQTILMRCRIVVMIDVLVQTICPVSFSELSIIGTWLFCNTHVSVTKKKSAVLFLSVCCKVIQCSVWSQMQGSNIDRSEMICIKTGCINWFIQTTGEWRFTYLGDGSPLVNVSV